MRFRRAAGDDRAWADLDGLFCIKRLDYIYGYGDSEKG
jgi:hypothetical protein